MPTRLSPLIAAVLAILFFSCSSLARAQTTIEEFNSQGQPTGSIETQGTITGFTYDSGINGLDVASESNGTSSLTQYDSNGNPIQSTTTPQPLGPLIYDSQNGSVVGVGPGRGNVTLYSYDQRQRQTRTEDILLPNNGGVSNGTSTGIPDINDVIGSPDRLGITTEYQYDSNFHLQGQFNVVGDATSITFDPGSGDYFVATNVAGTEELAVYDTNGNFVESMDSIDGIPLNSGSGPNGLAVGDFNGGGSPDLVFGVFGSANNSLLMAFPDGTFLASSGTGVAASFFDPLPNVDQANFAGMAVNPRSGAIFIAVTPESPAIWLFAPSLCLILMLCAIRHRISRRSA